MTQRRTRDSVVDVRGQTVHVGDTVTVASSGRFGMTLSFARVLNFFLDDTKGKPYLDHDHMVTNLTTDTNGKITGAEYIPRDPNVDPQSYRVQVHYTNEDGTEYYRKATINPETFIKIPAELI